MVSQLIQNLPTLNRNDILPVQKNIQGHPEAGQIWDLVSTPFCSLLS